MQGSLQRPKPLCTSSRLLFGCSFAFRLVMRASATAGSSTWNCSTSSCWDLIIRDGVVGPEANNTANTDCLTCTTFTTSTGIQLLGQWSRQGLRSCRVVATMSFAFLSFSSLFQVLSVAFCLCSSSTTTPALSRKLVRESDRRSEAAEGRVPHSWKLTIGRVARPCAAAVAKVAKPSAMAHGVKILTISHGIEVHGLCHGGIAKTHSHTVRQ
mmetsp:Transcript_158309/g.295207  ORF Transcript_158309/g.295207 Transcript_158309/m.295207 type:complete len:212 (+) Transcript_158309:136-771(+)